ncbi:MAG: DNA-directed RNA polymerase [Claussenomyces sp. TS43310]|nr:MAG: DNA-directed RNA polymerase [Claussenomyces sp. TS43310]
MDANTSEPLIRKRREARDGGRPSARRSLATAVDYRPIDQVPFEGLGQTHDGIFQDDSILSSMATFDPLKTVVLNNSLATPPRRHRAYNAIGGEVQEILSVLEACLQLGRVERAASIIRRLSAIDALGPEEMLAIHNQYMRVSVEKLVDHPNEHSRQALIKWFEVEIKERGIPIRTETLRYMLKAAVLSPPGNRRDRLIRRYMDMASGTDILSMDDFTADELAHITTVAPQYNFPLAATNLDEEEYELTTKAEAIATLEMKSIPDVRPVEQKGLGLKALKQSLSLFSQKPDNFDPDSLSWEARRLRQTRLEEDAVQSAIDRWREQHTELAKRGMHTSLETKSLGAMLWKWHAALVDHLEEELVKVEAAEASTTKLSIDNERCIYGPFLRYLPVEKLAAVTILTAMSALSSSGLHKGLALAGAITALGKSIEDESITERLRQSSSKRDWQKLTQAERGAMLIRRIRMEKLRQQSNSSAKPITDIGDREGAEASRWDPQWSTNIKAQIGSFLMGALIDVAKVPVTRAHPQTKELLTQMQPAFSHAYQYKLGKKTGMILGNPALVEKLKREPVHSLLAKHLPMVVEPEPWTEFNKGGFIVHPAKMMRIKLGDQDQRHYAEAAIRKGDMEQMFKGLDVLGKTSWKINQPVFETMLEAWNSGEAIATFPASEPVLEVPPEPESTKDPTERRRWLRAVKDVENTRAGLHSQRCFQNFQLEIARALRDETFYFPHNVDFRGRAYPIPPYLNHMGADHARGILKFGKGKELGAGGLKWLKVHLANVYGYDKASLSERAEFSTQHLDDIYDSATNPLNGRRWWLKAEDPWQCLAACFELKSALESPDPTHFVSHLPIHQDGTCNGLQHYAALGGDEWGARQVNLEPGDRPADVYSAVADLVKKSIELDRKKGNRAAEILHGKITRKVVKQTVMTNVYGVTYIGAKAQVRKQLVAAHPDLPNTPDMHPGILASYVATKIFAALSTMFRGAHDIQYWLGECATRISQALTPEQMDMIEQILATDSSSKSKVSRSGKTEASALDQHLQFKSSVIWTNPLRMPVVQPYRTCKSRIIRTNLQHISISEPHRSDPVSKRKQLQGFPPNFVHSLDATHMILSALKCHELGLSFAAVHDSFWTHAADIESMNNVLRDAFIRIHAEDVVGRLAAEFRARYKGGVFLAKIDNSSKLGQRIVKWRKSHRLSSSHGKKGVKVTSKRVQLSELLEERRRMRLLASDNPEEVEQGKKIVTPGSMFEEMASEGEAALTSSEHLPSVGLGEMSTSRSQVEPDDDAAISLEFNDDITVEEPDNEACSDEEESQLKGDEHFQKSIAPSYRKQKRDTSQWAWLPLTFPPIPQKGTFDVSRLKDSQYFFS